MPHSRAITKRNGHSNQKATKKLSAKVESRYTVGLAASLASEVERYAETVDVSMSKAIAALVRLGLDGQENRKREFFERLKGNLQNDDPSQQDRLIDDFRDLILGR